MELHNNHQVVVIPFPEQGHINPMLQLSEELAFSGTMVTFVNTEQNHKRMMKNKDSETKVFEDLLQFVAISDGLPPSSSLPITYHLLQSLQNQGPALQSLIQDLQNTGPPVSCLISDAFMPWTQDVALQLRIPWVVFWTASATRLCVNSFVVADRLHNNGASQLHADIPGLPLSSAHLAAIPPVLPPGRLGHLQGRLKAVESADCVLLNTFEQLEPEAISLNPRIKPIGPLFLAAAAAAPDRVQGSLIKPDDDCLPWLDTQETRSVLYISFGSKAALPMEQLEQLAMGIEASGKPFFWAIKEGQVLESFKERTRGKGRVVGWASQVRVLGHSAVGAFLTHCGWNSVMEALGMGVPMLCWPTFADQPNNRVLVEEQWRVGRAFRNSQEEQEGQLLQAHVVTRVIKEVMDEDKGFTERIALLSHAAKQAILPGGTSHQHFHAFLEDLSTWANQLPPLS